jgi:hypothetical protein
MPSELWAAILGVLAAGGGIGYLVGRDGSSRLGSVRSCRPDHRGSGHGHDEAACREVAKQPAPRLDLTTAGHGS